MMRLATPRVLETGKTASAPSLRRWPLDRVGRALERLLDAEIACKSSSGVADALASRCLFELTQAAGKAAR
jgi:hypothetical protein